MKTSSARDVTGELSSIEVEENRKNKETDKVAQIKRERRGEEEREQHSHWQNL